MNVQSGVKKLTRYSTASVIVLFGAGFFSYTSLDDVAHFLPNELNGLVTAPGLDVQLMAAEPMVKNPTNISVDERGRVWVTEAYNYRSSITHKPSNPEGDRIIILEDSNGDGVLDKSTLFYQGSDLNAPLGICVLGNKVIVSQSPYVWVFYDDNLDGKADRKEIMFQGIGGEQHDHGVHAFTFGPDGKLYFNFGNSGITLKDKDDKVVLDQDGDEIGPKKYKQGMIFRCDADGSHVEALADNFRNNYEVAIDSYGALWQSDNDDDGNKSTRISFVMDYGRYGYVDELTGASWRANRTNMESEIPLQHWHQNDPGVVPNLLATGAGSPTGMAIYEGTLLPKIFQNQMIHAEAGTNVVRAYPVSNQGAGYTATIADILKAKTDQWFRPSDVCVAPDGSLIISDWYDPAVGGHQAGDLDKGRIYRIAPTGQGKYSTQVHDYTTAKGAVVALQNPNLTVRYLAWTALQKLGPKSIPELTKLWNSKTADSRMRARALWALIKMSGKSADYIRQAIREDDANLRIVGIRAARELNADVPAVVAALVSDPDIQVRRECAIALHHQPSGSAGALWVSLARQYTGSDRWYLEALGIGADRQWDTYLPAFVAQAGDPTKTAQARDIIWRARTDKAVPYLAQLASDKTIPLSDRLRYFRAFDFNAGEPANSELIKMLERDGGNDVAFSKLVLRALSPKPIESSVPAQAALKKTVATLYGTPDYLEIVNHYELRSEAPNLLVMAINKSNEPAGTNAAASLLQVGGAPLVWDVLDKNDEPKRSSLLSALSGVGSVESLDILQRVAFTPSYDMSLRKQAATLLGKSRNGKTRVQQLLTANKVPEDILIDIKGTPTASAPAIVSGAVTLTELLTLNANAKNGKAVFNTSCFICHQVNGEGADVGPRLSEIGSKLPKESLLENIIHPSAGISFGYETWELIMNDGTVATGIVSSKTSTDLTLKFPGGGTETIKMSNVKSMKELKNSMMPDGLQQTMSKQDLADLLEYLAGLKKS